MRNVALKIPLVTGLKYLSLEVSLATDGVGEGEITCVLGIAVYEDVIARD